MSRSCEHLPQPPRHKLSRGRTQRSPATAAGLWGAPVAAGSEAWRCFLRHRSDGLPALTSLILGIDREMQRLPPSLHCGRLVAPTGLFCNSQLAVTKLWHARCFSITINLLHHSFVVEVKPLPQ